MSFLGINHIHCRLEKNIWMELGVYVKEDAKMKVECVECKFSSLFTS